MNDIEDAKAEKQHKKCCHGTSHPAHEAMGYAPLGGNPFAKAAHGKCVNGVHLKRRHDPCGRLDRRLNEFAALVFRLFSLADWSHLPEEDKKHLMEELAGFALTTADGGKSCVDREDEIRREVQADCEKHLEQGFQEAYEIILAVREEKTKAEQMLLNLVRHVAEKGGTVPSDVAAWLAQYASRFVPGPLTARVGDPAQMLVKGV